MPLLSGIVLCNPLTSQSWDGVLVGHPYLSRPTIVQRSGRICLSAEQTLAIICSDADGLEDDVEGQHLLKGRAHRPADGGPLSSASEEKDKEEEPWWRNRPLILTLLVTAWMLSIAKYNDELGPVFVSAPVKQVSTAELSSVRSPAELRSARYTA